MTAVEQLIKTLYEEYESNYSGRIEMYEELLPSPKHWDSSWIDAFDKKGDWGYHEQRTIRLINAVLDKAPLAELLTSSNSYLREYGKLRYEKD